MANSVSGQHKPNCALWLATQRGKMELSYQLGTSRRVPLEKSPRNPYNKSFIDQACSVKMAGYWPRSSFFATLWTSTPSRTINTQKQKKKKNLANIQSSWPEAWPIIHMNEHILNQESARISFDTWIIILLNTFYIFLVKLASWIFQWQPRRSFNYLPGWCWGGSILGVWS